MKFIHAANLRLGVPSENGNDSVDREQEIRDDFMKVIDACNRQEADALFLTGNVFSGDISEAECAELDDMLSGLETARVFMLTGQTETEAAVRAMNSHEWKSNVILFGGERVRKIYLKKFDTEITGIGYSEDTFGRLDLKTLAPGKRGKIQILLLPAVDEESENRLAGLIPEGYHYTGFGSDQLIMGKDDRPIYSPGLFEAPGFTRQIHHGFITGSLSLDKRMPELRAGFVPSARREYLVLKINAEREVPYEAVAAKVTNAVETYGRDNYYRIVICGEASQSLYLKREWLYSVGNVLEIEDRCSHRDTLARMLNEHLNDDLGSFIESIAPEEDDEIRMKALDYGIEALKQTENTEGGV